MDKFEYHYSWQDDVLPRIPRLEKADQGYTNAYTGLINLKGGTQVFVKCAMDQASAKWARKEIRAYKQLQNAGYEHMPQLLAVSPDETSFAIEALTGYDFAPKWDDDKLHAIMRARKNLKPFRYLFEDSAEFSMRSVVGVQNRWPMLRDETVFARANSLLDQAERITISYETLERCLMTLQAWQVRQDTLVHGDLRADNFAYNPRTGTGKLIDWTWLCIGDDTLDTASLCVNVARTDYSVYDIYPDLFDEAAIVSTMGYWFEVLGTSDGDLTDVRRSQARSVRVCYDLLTSRTQLIV